VQSNEVLPFETFCGICGGYINSEAQVRKICESVETDPNDGESEHVSYMKCKECDEKMKTFRMGGVRGARARHATMLNEEGDAKRTRHPH